MTAYPQPARRRTRLDLTRRVYGQMIKDATRTTARDNYGPHLLGRQPQPADPRDYQLAHYLASAHEATVNLDPQMTLADAVSSFPVRAWHDMYAFWHWIHDNLLDPQPAPTPAPEPAGAVEWTKLHGVSDQGNTGHCVGFTGLDFGNTLTVDDAWVNDEGHTIYYACKVIDGEPGAEDGSYTRSLCKVLQQMSRIDAYAFTSQTSHAIEYLHAKGSVFTGIPWDDNMFDVDANGFIIPGGNEAGGHEIEVLGHDPDGYGTGTPAVKFVNHWTDGWARGGFAYMTVDHWQSLVDRGGDIAACLELPLPAA